MLFHMKELVLELTNYMKLKLKLSIWYFLYQLKSICQYVDLVCDRFSLCRSFLHRCSLDLEKGCQVRVTSFNRVRIIQVNIIGSLGFLFFSFFFLFT